MCEQKNVTVDKIAIFDDTQFIIREVSIAFIFYSVNSVGNTALPITNTVNTVTWTKMKCNVTRKYCTPNAISTELRHLHYT